MIFKQYRYEPLSQASYILGCMQTKKGFVVDPIDDLGTDFYLREAADLGLWLVGVLETHVHADFISCARELAGRAGVPHYLHEAAKASVRYDFNAVTDGQELELGRVRVQVLYTPGHTPEHACFIVIDGSRSDEPWAVLTGDCLFVGDVGRPDLLLEDQVLNVLDESERALNQYHSIRDKLFRFPDHVEVWPGHYGGSTCGGVNMSGKANSTIYYEKRHNLAINQSDADSFARFVKETARPFPDNYAKIKSYNLGLIGRGDVAGPMEPALSVEEVVDAMSAGALLLDVRPPMTFALEHVRGSIDLQFNSADFGDRAEMALPDDREFIVLADSDAVGASAVTILRDAGFKVAGRLEGGLSAWTSSGRGLGSMPVVTVDDLREHPERFSVVDAREPFEFRYAHIPGAKVLSSMDAFDKAEQTTTDRPLAVVCGDQVRSATVASILRRAGRDAQLVSGGMTDWLERGYPVERSG